MNDNVAALDAGIAVGAANGDPELARQYQREETDVKRWFDELQWARKYDEPAREQYVKDRRYARGDSGFEVDANIVGTNIDILESFLYARDPDFDVTPGPAVKPPSPESLRDAVEDQMRADPSVVEAGRTAAMAATMLGVPQQQALEMGAQAEEARVEQLIRAEVIKLRKAFQRRQREIKSFAETCEIVGSRMWDDASLKRRGRPLVRSGLTIGVGVIKASWQERTAPSPETTVAINDAQANIERLRALKAELANGGIIDKLKGVWRSWTSDDDAKIAEYERQVQALQSQSERVVARGFVVDNVNGEDFQVAPGFTIANHLDAPWNAHRIFMRYCDAKVEFPHLLGKRADGTATDGKLASAKRYRPRRNVTNLDVTPFFVDNIRAIEADAFIDSNDSNSFESGQGSGPDGDWVALWEIWDRDSNTVLTGIEGVKCWVKPGWNPKPTTRFYPFFLYTTSEVDGQRHPQSLVTRSAKLVNEYNRIGSAEAEHRRRILPKMAFNAGQVDPTNAAKLEKGAIGELVPIELTNPQLALNQVLQPVLYPQVDVALYDRSRIIAEIERIWGVQEALSGGITVQKTATEADIQQQGFQARTGGRRDLLESMLGELALYTVELARAYMTEEDVRLIAGPDAFWPPYEGAQDTLRMLSVNIRAGSSGKPNTAAERASWAAVLPLLQTGIQQIGQLRGTSPAGIADSLEQLLRITAERSGERIDMDQLVPQADVAAMPGMPGVPGTMPGTPGSAPPPQGAEPVPVESTPGVPPTSDPLAAQT